MFCTSQLYDTSLNLSYAFVYFGQYRWSHFPLVLAPGVNQNRPPHNPFKYFNFKKKTEKCPPNKNFPGTNRNQQQHQIPPPFVYRKNPQLFRRANSFSPEPGLQTLLGRLQFGKVEACGATFGLRTHLTKPCFLGHQKMD